MIPQRVIVHCLPSRARRLCYGQTGPGDEPRVRVLRRSELLTDRPRTRTREDWLRDLYDAAGPRAAEAAAAGLEEEGILCLDDPETVRIVASCRALVACRARQGAPNLLGRLRRMTAPDEGRDSRYVRGGHRRAVPRFIAAVGNREDTLDGS